MENTDNKDKTPPGSTPPGSKRFNPKESAPGQPAPAAETQRVNPNQGDKGQSSVSQFFKSFVPASKTNFQKLETQVTKLEGKLKVIDRREARFAKTTHTQLLDIDDRLKKLENPVRDHRFRPAELLSDDKPKAVVKSTASSGFGIGDVAAWLGGASGLEFLGGLLFNPVTGIMVAGVGAAYIARKVKEASDEVWSKADPKKKEDLGKYLRSQGMDVDTTKDAATFRKSVSKAARHFTVHIPRDYEQELKRSIENEYDESGESDKVEALRKKLADLEAQWDEQGDETRKENAGVKYEYGDDFYRPKGSVTRPGPTDTPTKPQDPTVPGATQLPEIKVTPEDNHSGIHAVIKGHQQSSLAPVPAISDPELELGGPTTDKITIQAKQILFRGRVSGLPENVLAQGTPVTPSTSAGGSQSGSSSDQTDHNVQSVQQPQPSFHFEPTGRGGEVRRVDGPAPAYQAPTNSSGPTPVTPSVGQGSGLPSSAVDLVMSHLGQHERRDRDTIKKFLKDGGVGLDPATTAWCAATVNSALAQQGIKGTGSQVATSFGKWGTAVDPNQGVQKGDVVLNMGHARGIGDTGGHVGMATGNTRMGKRGLEVEMVSGNSSDSVRTTWEPAGNRMIRRAGANELPQNVTAQGTPVAPADPDTQQVAKPSADGGSPYITKLRSRAWAEVQSNPDLRDQVMRMGRSENQKDAGLGPMERLFNESARTGQPVEKLLHNTFYGPINRGDQEYTRVLTDDERKKFGASLDRVGAGSDTIGLRNDQGEDFEGHAGHTRVAGESYHYTSRGAQKWAEENEAKAREYDAVQPKEEDSMKPIMATVEATGDSSKQQEVTTRTADASPAAPRNPFKGHVARVSKHHPEAENPEPGRYGYGSGQRYTDSCSLCSLG